MRKLLIVAALLLGYSTTPMVADTPQSQTVCAQTATSDTLCSATSGNNCSTCEAADSGPNGPSSLLTDIIAYWSMDEASGNRADSTAAGLTLTDVNTVASAAGILNLAADFTAASSEALSRSAIVGADANLCISIWYYVPNTTTRYTLIDSGGDGDFYFRVLGGAGGEVRLTTTGFSDVYDGTTVAATGWHFFVVCHDADNNLQKISVDGGVFGTDVTTGPNGTPASFLIGLRTGPVEANDSLIDEVGAWSRMLTLAEVACLYGNGTPPAYPFTGVCPT